MSGGGGAAGPTAEEEEASAKAYWTNYSEWVGTEGKNREKNLGDIRARYAGQGKLGQILMDAEETKYQKNMEGLVKGEHGKSLQAYYEKMQQKARKPAYDNSGGSQESDSNNEQPQWQWVEDPYSEAGGVFVDSNAPSQAQVNARREFEQSPIDTSNEGMMSYYQKKFGSLGGSSAAEDKIGASNERARLSAHGGTWG